MFYLFFNEFIMLFKDFLRFFLNIYQVFNFLAKLFCNKLIIL